MVVGGNAWTTMGFAVLAACSQATGAPADAPVAARTVPATAGTVSQTLESLDLTARLVPGSQVNSGGNTAVIDEPSIQVRVVAMPARTLDEAARTLTRPGGSYQSHVVSRETTSDGWILVLSVPPDSNVAPRSVYIQRHVGTLDVECWINSPEAAGEKRGIEICQSLEPRPGRTATMPLPTEEPVVHISSAGGWSAENGFDLWADGTVLFRGPKCPKLRGSKATVDTAKVQAFLASLDGLAKQQDKFPDPCDDTVQTTFTVRLGPTRKTVRFGTCSKVPDEVRRSVDGANALTGPNPCTQ